MDVCVLLRTCLFWLALFQRALSPRHLAIEELASIRTQL
jgi:hypothetical protein